MTAIIRWLFVLCRMGVIFALSSIPSFQISVAHSYDFVLRKLAHLGEYAVLTLLLWWDLEIYSSSKVQSWLLAALAAALYGVSDEWHRSWFAGRHGSLSDIGIDVLGIATSYALAQHQPYQRIIFIRECPKCHAMCVYRSRRRGPLEWCARLLWLAPFRCDICSYRFWRFTLHAR